LSPQKKEKNRARPFRRAGQYKGEGEKNNGEEEKKERGKRGKALPTRYLSGKRKTTTRAVLGYGGKKSFSTAGGGKTSPSSGKGEGNKVSRALSREAAIRLEIPQNKSAGRKRRFRQAVIGGAIKYGLKEKFKPEGKEDQDKPQDREKSIRNSNLSDITRNGTAPTSSLREGSLSAFRKG